MTKPFWHPGRPARPGAEAHRGAAHRAL